MPLMAQHHFQPNIFYTLFTVFYFTRTLQHQTHIDQQKQQQTNKGGCHTVTDLHKYTYTVKQVFSN